VIESDAVRRLFAAIAFLTRFPVPAWVTQQPFGAAEVGRSTVVFPVVGAGIGALCVVVLELFSWPIGEAQGLPAPLSGILLVALTAWITGGMHLDGLADMTDGFGGGSSREEVLRIMGESTVGAFGTVALILLIGAKVTALSVLLERGVAIPYLIIAPTLGRWASVVLGRFLPYARSGGGLGAALTDHVGWRELFGATVLAGGITFLVTIWYGLICWVAVILVTLVVGRFSKRRIGGITGDVLGANIELSEAAVFVVAVALLS
jgi:cobalamin 5'-phosphate synthase/cobalamin synthase